MPINESVQGVLAQRSWKRRTLVEVANAGQLFLITEAEFNNIIAEAQLDEAISDIAKKAWAAAKKLPANLQAAQQAVVKATGKALDNANAAYVKANALINKIPLIGRIPEQTRNRLILGLALSFAAGAMGGHGDLQAGESGDTSHLHPTGAGAAGGDHAAAGGDHGGAAGGGEGGGDAHPAPAPEPHTTVTNASPDSHAQAVGESPETNKLFASWMQKNPTANHSMMRTQFHTIIDRIAAGDIKGGKLAATAFSDKMHMDENDKQALLQVLMKVASTAKANGVKMH